MYDKNEYRNHEFHRNQTLATYYNSISKFKLNSQIKINNTIRFSDRALTKPLY